MDEVRDPKRKSDERFIKDLKESRPAVEAAAAWLRSMGFKVRVPELRIREDPADAAEYADHGDILVEDPHGRELVIEVKHQKSYNWHSRKEFPFTSVCVDFVTTYDAKPVQPWFYLVVNQDMTMAFLVPLSSRQYWFRARAKESGRLYYYCPLDMCRLIRLNDVDVMQLYNMG